ncbi:MAG TPA: PD-(D/E)XK nuclease family protein, partial [Brevibacterium sp.]|nr:PD-(D/E)XK nuclease family protein [Brevibacterium sp.]
ELLAELRRLTGDESLSYDDLRQAHGPLACAVPRGRHPIDSTDLWLTALWNDGVLRRGDDLVREVFPDLARGHNAALLRTGDEPTHYHGILTKRPELDAELEEGIVYSATRLEALGSCPRRFFYRYILGVNVPDDPEWDPESWLTPLERGTLLHEVYESTLESARERGVDLDDVAFEEIAHEVFQGAVERMTHRVPPPSMAVHAAEVAALEEDLHAFVSLIRAERPDWIELELAFGPGADHEVAVEIGGRRVSIRGAIDRVDRLESGRLRVVDYKTGTSRQYRSTRPFHGGRRIQHILYMRAAESILGEEVEAMEYHFPTRRGENNRIRYGREALGLEREVLDKLFGIARDGHFITTEDQNDCRY